ncbi:YicC/YloC family endoribonuclease [Salaquimonas pukyongi]|uniref:YicC/YloC family endoribonuclease n=1 Tax=Salaquimonas pukyongi TaxID=2712698 RepID=UPI00096BBA17|nr:YicC/YloC family endoribonuclease [Salaquimonas pukyongi]
MALQSMTGFARSQGRMGETSWVWEIRSVNGKSLDVRFRLPAGLEAEEAALRELLCERILRGNIQVSLQLEEGAASVLPVLNEEALAAASQITRKVSEQTGLPPAGMEALLAIRGVVEYREAPLDPAAAEARGKAMMESFSEAVIALEAAREKEGTAIAGVLAGQIDEIERLTLAVADDPSRSAEAIRERLATQLARAMEAADGLDEQRLHQEAALLATKADLQEEIDRLIAHIASARSLLAEGGAVGRKLDFLSQEFNRECNTICSKSNAVAVTGFGLEMKVVIDRFKEQVQNIQ